MDEYKGAAKKLKMVLADKELTGVEFAKMAGMNTQTFYNMMNRNVMKYKQVEMFADLLGCDIVFRDRKTGKIY